MDNAKPEYGESVLRAQYREQLARLEAEFGVRDHEARYQKRVPGSSPHDVLELSYHDPLIAGIVKMWRHGDLSWEQALCLMVTSQKKSMADLQAQVVRGYWRSPGCVQIMDKDS